MVNWMETDGKMDVSVNTSTLKITPESLTLIAGIDEFKGAWRAIGRIAPERLAGLRRVATIESIGSSTRIEGAKLTDRDVERLLSNLEMGPFSGRDEQEVAGYADTMETVFAHWADIPLTENHIRQLHRDLVKYSDKDQHHRGAYKTVSNSVEAFGPGGESLGVVFETVSPFHTPRLMAELLRWSRATLHDRTLHPLLVIAVFVVVFLEIHPFQDGNGRLSRILTTLFLLQAGYAYVPYSSLESIIEHSKDAYYLALRQTQGTIRTARPDWQPWVVFFLQALRRQKDRLSERIERERLVLGQMPELSVSILELTRERGRLTVASAATLTGASRNTIKDHIKALTENGHLVRHGAGRGTWYALS